MLSLLNKLTLNILYQKVKAQQQQNKQKIKHKTLAGAGI